MKKMQRLIWCLLINYTNGALKSNWRSRLTVGLALAGKGVIVTCYELFVSSFPTECCISLFSVAFRSWWRNRSLSNPAEGTQPLTGRQLLIVELVAVLCVSALSYCTILKFRVQIGRRMNNQSLRRPIRPQSTWTPVSEMLLRSWDNRNLQQRNQLQQKRQVWDVVGTRVGTGDVAEAIAAVDFQSLKAGILGEDLVDSA